MPTIPGFEAGPLIHLGSRSRVLRARRESDGLEVVLKLPTSQRPGAEAIARLRHEWEIAQGVDHPHVIRYLGLERTAQTAALVLEGGSGWTSLAGQIPAGGLDLARFADFAIQLASGLAAIHDQRVVHKDLEPRNVLIDASGRHLKWTDFGTAARLDDDERLLVAADRLEGNLAYISPEQTGRMNRAIDHRADLYSLGVTLYELLCGRVPFTTTEPLELVHCHLAKLPAPPSEVRPELPEQLSRVVMKLLAKAPEDRYQSAHGVVHDLDRCRDALLRYGELPAFELRASDRGPELRAAQQLFGRDRELARLEDAWVRAAAGRPALVLVSGSSGVGKSALVLALEQRLADRPGWFIGGKFGQLGERPAYQAFTEAFRGLAGRILGANMDEFQAWRRRLSGALASHGRLVLDVLPEFEPIVGALPAVPALGPDESGRRFSAVFRRFVRACTTDGQPLTLFLDDLQWADSASLALIELLAQDREQSQLLLIASVRDDELDADHPTQRVLDRIRAKQPGILELPLRALPVADVEAVIVEALGQTPPRSRALAELVAERTAGNPLFIRTFLQMAWDERLLSTSQNRDDDLGWRWDEAGLRQMQASESIGELLARRIRQLSPSTQAVLATAACIGASFTPETIAAITGTEATATIADLEAAAQAGMILRRADERWDFVHDRVREAADALLPSDARADTHLRIARLLLATTPEDRLSERIFSLVDHFDAARTRIVDPDELVRLATLAEIAGRRAQMATAIATAARYFRLGVDALTALDRNRERDRAWAEHYPLTLALHRQLAVAEYLDDEAPSSRARIDAALVHVRDVVDRVELFELLVMQHGVAGRPELALPLAREGLALVGIEIPPAAAAADLDRALVARLAAISATLGDREIAALMDLPKLAGREARAAAQLLATSMRAAEPVDRQLFALLTAELVLLSLVHGTVPASSYGYAQLGAFVALGLGDRERGCEWGTLGLALAEEFGDSAQAARVASVVATLLPWSKPARYGDPVLDYGQRAAVDSGQIAVVAALHYQRQLLHVFAGAPLARLEFDLTQVLAQLRGLGQAQATDVVRGLALHVASLVGDRPREVSGDLAPFEREFVDECRANRSDLALAVHSIYQAQRHYLDGAPRLALVSIEVSTEFLGAALGQVVVAERCLYHSLALLRILPELEPRARRSALSTVDQNQRQLQRWARTGPANFEHAHTLVAAELGRCHGDLLGALDLYERASAEAEQQGFVHLHALANELAARMWLGRNVDDDPAPADLRLAQPYLEAAVAGWQRWGARRKLDALAAEFPDLRVDPPRAPRPGPGPSPRTFGSSQALDLAAVIRASQTISGEIDLDRLLARMMRIILLNAGANRGFLVLADDDVRDFRIAAAASSEDAEVERGRTLALADAELAVSIVRHVLASGDNVVLEHAVRRGPFRDDPHVVRRQLKSVLCMPLRHKDALLGVLYLENEHAAAAFTEARTEVLQILLSQAAISLENARYYDELKTLNTELQSRADELAVSKTRLEIEIGERERSQAERLQLEAQLRQSQKMEAIGQLAGGVAHDFNNLLTTIIGSTDVLGTRMRLDNRSRPGHELPAGAEEVRVIREAAEHGAALTRQLLAFSRRQVLQPELVDLNLLVTRSGSILERLLGAEVELIVELGAQVGRVRVDPSQLEQVVLNLVINARDALVDGGQVRVSTRVETLTAARVAQPQPVAPGNWVVLSVRDTGTGIAPETIPHIFEPFFTTKGVGEGTGLGLATVLGIVQQSDGYVTVHSRIGGTTFEIWLPSMTEPPDPTPAPEIDEPEPEPTSGGETVLVVEDEAPVRRTVEQILLLHGYKVLTAADGEACLALCSSHEGTIDLVLTDFVMPRLGGLDLAAKLRELQPDSKILFMSGFTDGQFDPAKVAALGGIELIEKPFRAAALLARIRELLDR